MKQKLLLTILMIFAMSGSSAAAPPLVLTADGGVFQIATEGGGQPSFVVYDGIILDLRDSKLPPKPPPSDLAKKIEAWAREANEPIVAKALATYVGWLREAVQSGSLEPKDVPRALKAGGDSVLGPKWANFRANLNSIAPANPTKQQAIDILTALETGLMAAADSAVDAATKITFPQLIELLLKLIQLLKDLGILK